MGRLSSLAVDGLEGDIEDESGLGGDGAREATVTVTVVAGRLVSHSRLDEEGMERLTR